MKYDLAIIGGGPGGYVGAIVGAQHGLNVLLVERDALGGTCLNRGCIPTKSWIQDSRLYKETVSSSVLSGTDKISFDANKMLARKQKVVSTLVGGVSGLLKSNGVKVIKGSAELMEPGRFKVAQDDGNTVVIQAENIMLATGSRPAVPPFIKIDGQFVQTTDETLESSTVPDKMVIVGGGVIGMEMATIYLNLGTQVTIIELLPDIMMTEDLEIRQFMKKLLKQRGAKIHLNSKVKSVKVENESVDVGFEDESGSLHQLQVDKVLVATGRAPVMDGLGIDKLGIKMNGPFVKVDAGCATNVKGIYAIGDLIGGMMLAHKASAEAEMVIAGFSGHRTEIKPELIPRCVWGITEIGAIGLTEEEARTTGRPIKIGKFAFNGSGAAMAYGKTEGFAKIIGDADNGEILGVHLIGEHATDMISEAVTVMKMEGVVEDLAEAIKPHPTLSETVFEAALDWSGKAIHSPRQKK